MRPSGAVFGKLTAAAAAMLLMGVLSVVTVAVSTVTAGPAGAVVNSTSPPFNECPAVGNDTGCEFLVIAHPGNSFTVLRDSTQAPFDAAGDDTLVGFLNQSGTPIQSIDFGVFVGDAFNFDGDGVCSGSPRPHACPAGQPPQGGYGGPIGTFANEQTFPCSDQLAAQQVVCGESFATLNFQCGAALMDGQSTFFSIQDAPTSTEDFGDFTANPENGVNCPPTGGGGGIEVLRQAGTDRVGTSVDVSQAQYPLPQSSDPAFIARDDTFSDALATAPLAAKLAGPILLTAPSGLDPRVASELQRVLVPGSNVYIMGGTAALSPQIDGQVAALGFKPVRVAGATAAGTAVAIAGLLGNPSTVFEADGTNFPDALSAGWAAAEQGGAVLLTNGSTQFPETASYVAAHPGTHYAVGGPAAVADPGATPVVGADRFDTAAKMASLFAANANWIGVASGVSFPDALTGGPEVATHKGAMLLANPSAPLPAPTAGFLTADRSHVSVVNLFGGTSALGQDVANAINTLLNG